MRVVHLACVAPPEIGGIGQAALSEVVGLRARGIDAELVAPSVSGATSSEQFMRRVPSRLRLGNAAVLSNLSSVLTGSDLIHLHYPFYGTAEPLLWRRSKRTPVVMTFHMDAEAPGWKGKLFDLHRAFLQPALLSKVDRILVSSYDYAEHSSLAPFLKRYPERVTELPFGVDTTFFSPAEIPEPISDASHFKLLFVGGLDQAHAFKGLPDLFFTLTRLPHAVELSVVGDGDLRREYEKQTQAMGLTTRVHFLGRLDSIALRDAYRQADLLVMPSTSAAEAFGLVALEAQACGLPVLAAAWPGVRTVVRHGETGWLVPPCNREALISAVLAAIASEPTSPARRLRSRTWVEERFSLEKHVDKLIRVYDEVRAHC